MVIIYIVVYTSHSFRNTRLATAYPSPSYIRFTPVSEVTTIMTVVIKITMFSFGLLLQTHIHINMHVYMCVCIPKQNSVCKYCMLTLHEWFK